MFGEAVLKKPLNRLAWEANLFPRDPSITLQHLEFGLLGSQATECLRTLSRIVVIMEVVVVNANCKTAAATGLFGLLGDAHVQIVDLSEQARLDALKNLVKGRDFETSGAVYQRFHQTRSVHYKELLQESIYSTSEKEQLWEDFFAKLRPAIMFRL